MNNLKLWCASLLTCAALNATAQTSSWTADNGNGTFTNPLFYDEFSDPDVIRVGEDYYLAGTTMHSVPGLVILHSKDLVNWENVSYCFDRFDFARRQVCLKKSSRNLWAGHMGPLHPLCQWHVLCLLKCQWQRFAVLYQ